MSKRANLFFHVVLHAADDGCRFIQQQVGGPRVAILGQSDAAGIGDDPATNHPHVGPMDMRVHCDGRA